MNRSSFAAAAGRDDIRTGHSLAVGAVCGLLAVVQSIGFGTLLFSGVSETLAARGIGLTLFTSVVAAAITPFASSSPRVVSVAQGIIAGALAGILAAIATRMPAASEAAIGATLVAAVALATLLGGLTVYLLGHFGLSRLIRFIPFPVVGGFLAGTGWLILVGGAGMIVGGDVLADPLGRLADPVALSKLLAALAFIGTIMLAMRLTASRLVLPMTVAAALILFNLVVWIGAIPTETLRGTRWLIGIAGNGFLWPPVAAADLALIDWSAIASQALSLPTVAVLTAITLLMNAAGIELEARRDLDLDRELRAAGLTNLLSAAGGGSPGFANLSLTVLASRLGAPGAAVGLTVAAVCLAALVFGRQILSLVPMPILGAVLIWIGGGFVREWLIRSYPKLSRSEYSVVVLIFLTITVVGFAWGILLGLIATAALFVVQYGRVNFVRYTLSGRDYQTRGDASDERLALLRDHGDAILIMRLQGFLFFGTADRLRGQIEARLGAEREQPIRFLILDFERVSGLDSSAVLSFMRLAQMAGPSGFTLVLTGMSGPIQEAMTRGGLEPGDSRRTQMFRSLESGLEWCENALLAEVAPDLARATTRPALDCLVAVVGEEGIARALMAYLERVEIANGEALIAQGSASDDLFFIEEGRAAVELINRDQTVRLATVGHGAIVGEVAYYLAVPRTASVTAETDMVVWRLSRAALERLNAAEPAVAARFHQGMASMLADRLTHTNRLVQMLAS